MGLANAKGTRRRYGFGSPAAQVQPITGPRCLVDSRVQEAAVCCCSLPNTTLPSLLVHVMRERRGPRTIDFVLLFLGFHHFLAAVATVCFVCFFFYFFIESYTLNGYLVVWQLDRGKMFVWCSNQNSDNMPDTTQ